jgi:hypothetical protein
MKYRVKILLGLLLSLFVGCSAPAKPIDSNPVQPVSVPASAGAVVVPASKEVTPTNSASLPALDVSCKVDADCVNSPYILRTSATCCAYPHCKMTAGNATWADAVKQLCEGPLKPNDIACPLVDCPVAKKPICSKGSCAFR